MSHNDCTREQVAEDADRTQPNPNNAIDEDSGVRMRSQRKLLFNDIIEIDTCADDTSIASMSIVDMIARFQLRDLQAECRRINVQPGRRKKDSQG